MKKKRIFALALSAVICAGSFPLSNFSANAIAGFAYDLELPVSYSDYELATYSGVWVGSGYCPSAIFQKSQGTENGNTAIIQAQLLSTNCATLTITEDGFETFEAIYAEYTDELNFDCYNTEESEEQCIVYLYDTAPITDTISTEPIEIDSKEDLLLDLCDDLLSAGVLSAAEYHATEWVFSPGFFSQTIIVVDLPEGEEAAIQEIVSTYDTDAVVTEGIIVEETEEEVYGYTITPVEDYVAYNKIGSALNAAYPDATVGVGVMILESSSSIESTSIDLLTELDTGDTELTATICGDVNLDGKVNIADVIRLNKYVAGIVTLEDQQLANADCYADGLVDADDALTLLQYMVSMINTLPVTEDVT